MRPIRPLLLLALVVAIWSPSFAAGTAAQGVVVAPPRCDPACPPPTGDSFEIRSLRADVTIHDQIAATRIDQTVHNPNRTAAEATMIFPLPPGAAVSGFTLWIDGEPVKADLLDADAARHVYDDIVRSQRDPGLLEYVGGAAVQASVFPIPPGSERQVRFEYSQVLPIDAGLAHYVAPLGVARFSAQPIDQISVRVAIDAATPLRAIYSPSHDVAIDRIDDRHAVVGFEGAGAASPTDFDLYYSASPDPIGANVVSYVDPATGDGTFMLLAAPGIEARGAAMAKDVILVLDTSGSMKGEKLAQAKTALDAVLNDLAPDDRFAAIEFSTGARPFADALSPASRAADARVWVDGLRAKGGTDIDLALQSAIALVDPNRPTMVLFLTDGLPTEGVTDAAAIERDVAAVAPPSVRLFAFGVGDDVDTLLLDRLTATHHGRTTYVRPGQAIDEQVSGLYASISAPVLSDVRVAVDGVPVSDLYPRPVPDLFAGSQLVVLGRYSGGGAATVTLSGTVDGEARTYRFDGQTFATAGGETFLPRLWATRKVGYLLDQIRLNGESDELIDEIVDLSVRYGIVTPYTSYLVTEPDILTDAGRDAALEQARAQAAAPAEVSGASAVDKAQASASLRDANVAAPMPATVAGASGEPVAVGDVVRAAGDRTFVLRNDVWTDTTFDPEKMTPRQVSFGSDAYFALLDDHPDLAPALALGQRLIVVAADGTPFEVVP